MCLPCRKPTSVTATKSDSGAARLRVSSLSLTYPCSQAWNVLQQLDQRHQTLLLIDLTKKKKTQEDQQKQSHLIGIDEDPFLVFPHILSWSLSHCSCLHQITIITTALYQHWNWVSAQINFWQGSNFFDPSFKLDTDTEKRTRGCPDIGRRSLVGFQAPLVRLVGYSGRRVRRRASLVGVGGLWWVVGGTHGGSPTRASSSVALTVALNC